MKGSSTVTGATASVIKDLEDALQKGNAHVSFEDAVKNIPHGLLGSVPDGLPYSLWQLVEHIRLAQWDILEFCRDPRHQSPEWPKGFWPAARTPAAAADFAASVAQVVSDRTAFIGLLHSAGEEIYTPFPHGDGQSLFREALLIIDHTSYHIGEILVLRRLLGAWK
ncbi:MAG TPA: DinB family protein [Puia sp.]|jgi:hypothetical protein|nr:DinB family protein [Puia sp.]